MRVFRGHRDAGTRVFRDRRDAGVQLARLLQPRAFTRPLVLGIPRGGVLVSVEVARALGAEHGVVVARKLGAPGQPELAIGAVSADGSLYVDRSLAELTGADAGYLAAEQARQVAEARRREETLDRRRRPSLTGRDVVVVDDGVATGATAIAALRSVRARGAARVLFAVPVGPPATLERLREEADEVVCLWEEPDLFAVGQFYLEFASVEDTEVRAILEAGAQQQPIEGHGTPRHVSRERTRRNAEMNSGMPTPLTLALAGDVMLGRLVDSVIPARGFAWPWGDLLPVLAAADLVLINLECALTTEIRRARDGADKPFHFRADPSVVNTLTAGHVDGCVLANNHIADFGVAGLRETLAVLDRAGIAHAGAGPDAASAAVPARLVARGCRVAVVAFADYPEEWAATPVRPGINYTPVSATPADFRRVEEELAAARAGADLVVFSIHWGPNMRERPSAPFRAFARRVVSAGADVFWGHSAHLVQAVEVWNGKLILFDTGDFVDDYAVEPELRNDLSALFLVRARPPDVLGLDLVPVQISDRQVRLARSPERDWFVRRFVARCREVGTPVVVGPDRVSIPVPPPSGAA